MPETGQLGLYLLPNSSSIAFTIEIVEGVLTDHSNGQRVTVRDIASAAGVSISTVSLYTQGKPGVSPATGQRIASVIQQLGYVPRQPTHRRKLPARRSQSKLFGLLLEEMSLSAFPETLYGAILKAIETEAKQFGYSMVLSVIDQECLPTIMTEEQISGVIILGGCPLNDAVALRLAQRKIPLVLLDNYVIGAPIDAIVPDNEWGGYQAIRHLVGLGHVRIGIIEGPVKYKTLTDRLWGALRAAHDSAFPFRPITALHPNRAGNHSRGTAKCSGCWPWPNRRPLSLPSVIKRRLVRWKPFANKACASPRTFRSLDLTTKCRPNIPPPR